MQQVTALTVSLTKQQSVVTHTIRQTDIPTSLHSLVTNTQTHILSKPCVHNKITCPYGKGKGKSSPVTGLEWPRGFQEVKVPRFHDNGTGSW
jgi:microcystin-dependent protein